MIFGDEERTKRWGLEKEEIVLIISMCLFVCER